MDMNLTANILKDLSFMCMFIYVCVCVYVCMHLTCMNRTERSLLELKSPYFGAKSQTQDFWKSRKCSSALRHLSLIHIFKYYHSVYFGSTPTKTLLFLMRLFIFSLKGKILIIN